MTTPADSPAVDSAAHLLPGLAVTALTPGEAATQTAVMLIVLLAGEGANVAAMVPVETGIEAPCHQGSRGSLIRWAAGHLDDPRHVTPFALEADRSAMHAADASGTLLHGAAFDRAREALSDERTVLVVCDGIGVLDPITPSLTMLDLLSRWQLGVVLVEPVSRWTVGHVRLLAATVTARGLPINAVVLTDEARGGTTDPEVISAMQDTIGAMLDCPVLLLPRVMSLHDRAELLAAARECGMHRVVSRIHVRPDSSADRPLPA